MMVALNHRAGRMPEPCPRTDAGMPWATFHMSPLSLLEDGVLPRAAQRKLSGHAARNFPAGAAGPALGALLTFHGPKPHLPSWFQASIYCVFSQEPLPGPWALSYKDPVGPVLVESFVAWTVSGSHNPTHSECPRQVSGREAFILSFVTFQTVVRTWNTI